MTFITIFQICPSSQIILDIAKWNIDLLQRKTGFAQFLALSQTVNNVRNQRPGLRQKYSILFMGKMRLRNTLKIPFILSKIISHLEHKLYLHLLPNYFLIEFHNQSIFCFIFDLIGKGVPNKRTQLFQTFNSIHGNILYGNISPNLSKGICAEKPVS